MSEVVVLPNKMEYILKQPPQPKASTLAAAAEGGGKKALWAKAAIATATGAAVPE